MAAMVAKLINIDIPHRIDRPNKRSILNVSGVTNELQQLVAVSLTAVEYNATNNNHKTLVISHTP